MDNLSDAERQHIQNVLERADSRTPYTIKVPLSHQLTARTESFQSSDAISIAVSRNSLDDGIDAQIQSLDDAIRRMSAGPAESSQSPPQDLPKPPKTEEVGEALDATTAASREIEAAKSASPEAPLPSTSSYEGFGSFLRKASSAIFHAADIWSKEPASETRSPSPSAASASNMEEIEQIQKQAKLAERGADGGRALHPATSDSLQARKTDYGKALGTDSRTAVKSGGESELTFEELEHIRRVSELAEKDFTMMSGRAEPPKSPRPTEAGKQGGGELTQDELDHINRVAQMAMHDEGRAAPAKGSQTASVASPSSSLLSADELHERRSVSDVSPSSSFMFSMKRFSGFGLQSLKNVVYGAEEPKSPVPDVAGGTTKVLVEPQIAPPQPSVEPHDVHQEELKGSSDARREQLGQTDAVGLPPPPTQEPPMLSQEELDHINRITQRAMEQERKQYEERPQAAPSTSTSIFGAKSLTGFGFKAFKGVMHKAEEARTALEDLTVKQEVHPSPAAVQAEPPQLTQEELDHINRINQMAAASEEVHGPPSVPKQEPPELTQEELDHINRVAQMAMETESWQETRPKPPVPEHPPEITQEELDHIRRINEMAAREESREGLRQRSSVTSPRRDGPERKESERPSEPLAEPRPPQSHLAEPVKEHEPHSPTSIFDAKSITGFGFKAFKGVMQKAEGARTAFEDLTMRQDARIPPPPEEVPSQLTQEELDHINRINQMAMEGEEKVQAQQQPSVSPFERTELTQEELDHINRIAQMAKEEESHRELPPKVTDRNVSQIGRPPSEPQPPLEAPREELPPASPRASVSLFDTKSFTGFGMKAFKGVIQKAEEARTAFEDLTTKQETPSPLPPPVEEPAGLTQEELDHINRINQMALQDGGAQQGRLSPMAVASGAPELTQEELDHINRITQMAMEEDIRLQEVEGEESMYDEESLSEDVSDEQSTETEMASEGSVEEDQPSPSLLDSSIFSTKTLTGFGIKAFKGVMQKAEEARTTFEDLATKRDAHSPPSSLPAEVASELTQEELDHINRINQMAMEDETVREARQQLPVSPFEPTQEELDHINRVALMDERRGRQARRSPTASYSPGTS
ncbi:hypothetical protein COOONC_01580 [Cooperia oncophora]